MYKRSSLFVLFSGFLALAGCSDSMNSESNELATCVSGVYSGTGDFTKFIPGSASFNLEVNTNGQQMVFLVTATESKGKTNEGDQFCSVYQTPQFTSTTPDAEISNNFDIESDSVISTGKISHTFAISEASMRRALSENEDGTTTTNCFLSTRIKRDASGTLGTFVPLNYTRDNEAEVRSFSEIKSICNGLETQETEEAETEVTNTENVFDANVDLGPIQ